MPRLSKPTEIRALLRDDPAQVTDPQLLALLLATGASRRRSGGRPKKTWTAVELAEDLYAAAGWRLDQMVRKVVLDRTLGLSSFGLGKTSGGRLVAAMELAQRFGQGFEADGDGEIRSRNLHELSERVFLRQADASEGELITLLSGGYRIDVESVRRLLKIFGSPSQLVRCLTSDRLASFLRSNDDLIFGPVARFRLLAGIELARRYRVQARLRSSTVDRRTLGLSSIELVDLLDPASPLERSLRLSLIDVLRSHPELAGDFATLDRLARDAGTRDYERAIELHQMFEVLCHSPEWSSPAEVLGGRVPYSSLLAIAEARIAGARKPPVRVLKVRELLKAAERECAARPAAAFVEALLELGISESGAEGALAVARARFRERLEGPQRRETSQGRGANASPTRLRKKTA